MSSPLLPDRPRSSSTANPRASLLYRITVRSDKAHRRRARHRSRSSASPPPRPRLGVDPPPPPAAKARSQHRRIMARRTSAGTAIIVQGGCGAGATAHAATGLAADAAAGRGLVDNAGVAARRVGVHQRRAPQPGGAVRARRDGQEADRGGAAVAHPRAARRRHRAAGRQLPRARHRRLRGEPPPCARRGGRRRAAPRGSRRRRSSGRALRARAAEVWMTGILVRSRPTVAVLQPEGALDPLLLDALPHELRGRRLHQVVRRGVVVARGLAGGGTRSPCGGCTARLVAGGGSAAMKRP